MIRQEIKNLLEKAIKELQEKKVFPRFEIPETRVEHPEEKAHGDYATNVAMLIARQVKKNPMEIADNLKFEIFNLEPGLFDKVEIASPGFVNFFISKEYLQKQVEENLKQKERFGQLKIGKGEKINVEFISANPTGELHLGHGRGAFFGDCLSNVLDRAGYEVTKEYYINDTGKSLQVVTLRDTTTTVTGSIEDIQFGSLPYYGEYLKKKITEIQKRIGITTPAQIGSIIAEEIQKDNKNFIEDRLKIKFDKWVSEEKDLYGKGKVEDIYEWLEKKKLVYEKEGAKWLETSKYGDTKDWVVKRSEKEGGEYTYLLSDIAYHKDEFDRGFDKLIDIWGADHQGHVGKIKAAIKMLGYDVDNLDILISQVVRLKGGKISKREGRVVTLEWLINEVGADAARFFYIMKSLDTQMEFDVKLAKEKSQKSPVYYVQYAYARICSIFKKSNIKNHKSKNLQLLVHPSELNLIKQLIRLREIIVDTSKDYQIQRLPQYAVDLATAFHQFYRDCKVLSEAEGLCEARLSLVLATKIVLKNTLALMGVSAPEKM